MIALFLRHPARQVIPCFPLFLLLSSCDRVSSRMEITHSRDISQYEPKPKVGAYPQERFGDERLIWQTPDGWSQAERSQMRPVNLAFGPNKEGECYLSLLPGGGRRARECEPLAQADGTAGNHRGRTGQDAQKDLDGH